MTTSLSPAELLARTGVWHIDPFHTGVHFAAVNRAAGRVRGRFDEVSGTLTLPLDDIGADIVIATASLSTGNALRDGHLRTADFLDTERHPQMRFTAHRLDQETERTGRLHGALTLRGSTHPVTLDVSWQGAAPDPLSDAEHLAFSATARISLADYGIRPQLLPGLSIPGIADAIDIILDVVLLPYDPAAR
ncbi:YceI family protein [Streptomyces sp. NPDC002671]